MCRFVREHVSQLYEAQLLIPSAAKEEKKEKKTTNYIEAIKRQTISRIEARKFSVKKKSCHLGVLVYVWFQLHGRMRQEDCLSLGRMSPNKP